MNPTVYIETTIVSDLTARPSRDLIRAAEQRITGEWWDDPRHRFHVISSPVVVVEASAGDAAAAADRLNVLNGLPLLGRIKGDIHIYSK